MLSASDANLGKELLEAAASGMPVLLRNVELGLGCPELLWLLQREHLRLPEVHPYFCLYLSTSLHLEALPAGLSSETLKDMNIIEMHTIREVLEEQLLQEIIRAEKPDLETRWHSLELNILNTYDQIEVIQEKLLRKVLNTETEQLGRNYLLRDLLCYQAELYQKKAHLEELKELKAQEAEFHTHFRDVACLGTTLAQATSSLQNLHPLYSLALDNSLTVTCRTLASIDHQLPPQHGEDLESHLQDLGNRLTRRLLNNTLISLQPRHGPLVGVLGALALLQVSGQAPALERLALCPGLAASPVVSQKVLRSDVACPSWLGPKAWQECGLLELLPPFVGLRASLAGNSGAWQEYLRLPSTVVGQTPGLGTKPLSLLQKLVLWRVLQPEKLANALADFTTCLLGRSLSEDKVPAINPYKLSRPTRPLIVLMPPPGHPTATSHPLPFIWKLACRQKQEHLQVIGLGSSLWDSDQAVTTVLSEAMRKGNWVVLDNCHLMSSWSSELLEPLLGMLAGAQVTSEVLPQVLHQSGTRHNLIINKNFRLWLISSINAIDSLPVVVIHHSVPIFWEQSLELGHILICNLHERSEQISKCQDSSKISMSLTLSVPVMFLHSLLLYRQLYGPWLQAKCGKWNQMVLEQTLKVQEWIWKKFSNHWVALQELTGTIFYGGPVADHEDKATILSLVRICLDSKSKPKPGSCTPQNLLASLTPCPGMSELEASSAVEAQAHLIALRSEPCCYGVSEGPQAWLVKKKSRALWASLRKAQNSWEPSGLPNAQMQGLHQVEYRLKCRVSQAIRRLKALQAMLTLSSPSQPFGWSSFKGLQTLEGFLKEEATTLSLLLLELHGDLSCLESQLAGALPCSSPRCEKVATALWAGRLPPPWRRHMSAGPQPPWLWLHQLWHRGQLLTRYLNLCAQLDLGRFEHQNRSFHLSAFHHPRGLFLAIRWEASHNWISPYNTLSLRLSRLSGRGHPSPSCPASYPGAHPHFQLKPSFVASSRGSALRQDHSRPRSVQHSHDPDLPRGSEAGLGPNFNRASTYRHSIHSRFGSTVISPRSNVGHFLGTNFVFGHNFNIGIPRQGIQGISLHFRVECGPTPSASEDGLLIMGLLLHHAEWNSEAMALQDGHSGKPSPLPPVSVNPHFINQEPPLPFSPLPFYHCPVYLGGLLGHSQLDSAHLLFHLPLPTKLCPDICVQRRVYVCSPPLT